MKFESLLYGWLPALLAIGSLAASALAAWKTRSVIHVCLSVIIFVSVFWALYMLYRIFEIHDTNSQAIVLFGQVYRNRVPQLVILAVFFISMAQGIHAFSRRTTST